MGQIPTWPNSLNLPSPLQLTIRRREIHLRRSLRSFLEVPYVTVLHIWLHGFDRSDARQDNRRFLLRQALCKADQ